MKKKTGRSAAGQVAQGVPSGPTLREFWLELRRAKEAGEPLPSASPADGESSGGAAAPSSGAISGSGSFFGSSGGGGYGLGLILPDEASRRRIARIMEELCERDKER